ncbi:MAG: (Fe-S)-binding protein [Polyangiaceae bacterium]|nr:(Fe-S)-binding protein [Myxococcales bacterium]MCB9589275.1 (Fe-S)-binding protein [Polyangiaceae bacterium]
MTSFKLPLLQHREAALETCAYCPKLCRAACPVADVESSETLTPWGKMGLAWYQARGSLELNSSYAATAWGCSGCYACRDHCDHKNPVAETLLDARAEAFVRGLEPPRARSIAKSEPKRRERREAALTALAEHPAVDPNAQSALLLGCAYANQEPELSRAALDVVLRVHGKVRLLSGCCGGVSRAAGDAETAEREERALAAAAESSKQLIVLDPGCAGGGRESGLRARGALTLVELVATRLDLLGRLDVPSGARWHDPCQLGRGLGVFEAPRAILTRILGEAPGEFARSREEAVCSGAGGLLPVTMPDASGRIAAARIADHEDAGGGTIVTGCASSLRRFKKSGAEALDIVDLIARSLAAGDA